MQPNIIWRLLKSTRELRILAVEATIRRISTWIGFGAGSSSFCIEKMAAQDYIFESFLRAQRSSETSYQFTNGIFCFKVDHNEAFKRIKNDKV